ncbi:MAG: hypothetical protein DCF21_04735 [Leptolyngbya sp.]|nr:MAG: hypothetical protein DCF21_04735 [Leptolyngbya sp.]
MLISDLPEFLTSPSKNAVKIRDLAYLENLAEKKSVMGGALLEVTAVASATGSTTYTLADTSVMLKTVGNGKVTIGKGKGTALAIGDDPYAHTNYYADGFDKVIVNSRSGQGKRYAVSHIRVFALDVPR